MDLLGVLEANRVQYSFLQVVASQDWPEVTKYAGLVSAQAHRQELIQDLFKVWQDPQRGTVTGGMIKYNLCNLMIHITPLVSIAANSVNSVKLQGASHFFQEGNWTETPENHILQVLILAWACLVNIIVCY